MPVIQFTDKGLYCPAGDFYIDPWKPVNKAVITHAHGDHARWGNQSYLCHHFSVPILKLRLGDVQIESVDWNETVTIYNVKISLHPAGHIIGSSQVRIEVDGEVWVISGDYKTEYDGISQPFEPVKCNAFVTESTFGLPIYKWKPQREIFSGLQSWITKNKTENKTSVLIAYSLGKAQRILLPLAQVSPVIYAHGAVWNLHQTLLQAGWKLPALERITPETPKESLKGAVVIAPPGAEGSLWMKRFNPYAVGICSGWMQVRGNVRRKNADAGFVISDHADWPGLLESIKATGAEKVFVTHGFQATFSRYLNELGIESAEVKTEYGGEEETQLEAQVNETEELNSDI
ncbi:MAG: ligase-associated damage response exonuclease [Chitinophagaceae bacterium]|nr:ligase-associated damage response exonuclease [Chitinophagaceae bacterium]